MATPLLIETENSSKLQEEHSESSEDEDEQQRKVESWDDWDEDDEEESPSDYLCLFCTTRFDSADTLFHHCKSQHSFDFRGIVEHLSLDFYSSLKLINYVRSQVAANRCWGCGLNFRCNEDLQSHLHTAVGYAKADGELLWEDDVYLKPSMADDALLHSFATDDDDDDDDDCRASISKDELMRELMGKDLTDNFEKIMTNDTAVKENQNLGEIYRDKDDGKQLTVSFANAATREIKNVNDKYFGAYGSFGIHREMISDKVRTDAYRDAILLNPSLMKRATVLDVGCGTGILSLFAAQAGAARVIAVEASAKMASVATQIAKDNGLLSERSKNYEGKQCSGVIHVVQSMVEDLDKYIQLLPHSIDVLVSEWMGYCLLYESMLSSVLYARDRWLKPGGAILPDTATIFIAGFGRGGTSLPFWENVYGFNMSCIGKEVVEDAAKTPIVDVVDSTEIVTVSVSLKFFDLTTMRPDDIDFTETAELELKSNSPEAVIDEKPRTCWCHGIVFWFETGFTSRFCKEMPIVLSTSTYTPRTHWSQTILTFQEPIAMTSAKSIANPAGAVGTEGCPVVRIRSRISIARSSHHRSIDISMETTGISSDGRKHSWPAQIFNL